MNLEIPEQPDQPLPTTPPPLKPAIARWRWWIHVLVIGSYPLVLGILGYLYSGQQEGVALSDSAFGVIQVSIMELLIFGTIFAIGWSASRANADALMLRWRKGLLTPLFGFGYSIGLRVLLGILVGAGLSIYVAATGGDFQEIAQQVQPNVEAMVDYDSLSEDPLYLFLNMTLISFVVAGFREELWRAGVIAGLSSLFPKLFGGTRGKIFAVLVAAVIFGLGHLTQGWGAVFMTGVLGIGLGVIMVLHRSIWEAVIAHGFFNATSFLLIAVLNKFAPDLMG